VTLSDSSAKLLEEAMASHPESRFLFPGETPDKPLVHSTFRRLMAALGYGKFDPHGHRKSFRTWMQDCTDLDRIAAEIALAHRVGSVVEETYATGEMFAKRRVLAQAWDDYLAGKTAEVVVLVTGLAAGSAAAQ